MMLYEKSEDRRKFFKKVAKAIGQGEEDGAPENTEKGIGGDLDLDGVLPPPSTVGGRVPTNSARKVPARGGSFRTEGLDALEDKLCAILQEQLSSAANKVGVQGRVQKLGHSNPNVTPSTNSGEARDEDDSYAKSRLGKKKQNKKKEDEDKGDILDQIAAEMGMEGEDEA